MGADTLGARVGDGQRWAWLIPVPVLLTILAALLVADSSIGQALVVGLLVAASGLATWRITRRWALGLLASAIASAWPIPHGVGLGPLAGALLVLMLFLVPGDDLVALPRAALALGGALLAAGIGLLLSAGLTATGIAAAATFLLVLALPRRPTREAIQRLRQLALVGPGLALVGLVVFNAATGWLEQATAASALALGAAAAALFVLLSLTLLGMATLLESDDPSQLSAWTALSVSLALLVAVVPQRSPNLLQAAAAVWLGPLAILPSISVARLRSGAPRRWLWYAVPLIASLGQIGLL